MAKDFSDLDVYKNGCALAMDLFELSKKYPSEEKYSLVDQVRRSSRSVCANLAEAWKKRRYRAAFIAKLSDAEAEANETLVWIDFSMRCGYIEADLAASLESRCRHVTAQLAIMIRNAHQWLVG